MSVKSDIITSLANCAAACDNCSDKCLDEPDIKKMVKCIRLDRDCSHICHTGIRFVASNSSYAKQIIKQCEEICRACGDECEKMETDHCKECAKACRECEEACRKYLAA